MIYYYYDYYSPPRLASVYLVGDQLLFPGVKQPAGVLQKDTVWEQRVVL